jgi:hypothetical protein
VEAGCRSGYNSGRKEPDLATESEAVLRLREIVREVGFSFHSDHALEDWIYMGLPEDKARAILSICDAVEQEGLDPDEIALEELGQTEENEQRYEDEG